MVISNKWGQGQLFAFSALDGSSYFSDDLVGTLSGDRIGVRFFSKVKRELAIVNLKCGNLEYSAVTSDYICCKRDDGEIKIIYHQPHLIIGCVCGGSIPVVFCEGIAETKRIDNIEVQDTSDGEYTAILRDGDKFAFAYGKSESEVIELAKRGISEDIQKAEQKKMKFYEEYSLDCGEYSALFSKCLSAMKTQLYSPEGEFKTIWSTPDRLPHKHLWLWDSVFHAIGHRHISEKLAQDLIRAVLATCNDEGFIPHRAGLGQVSDLTQPPVLAWGALKVCGKNPDKEFLAEVFEKNSTFLEWCRNNRRMSDEELYIWKTVGDVECRCGESGMDNSSRFDEVINAQAIDFSCFMANETRCMCEIAKLLGKTSEADYYNDWFEKIKLAINEKLWDSEDEFYYDYDFDNNHICKVKSEASFLPLFSGVCDKERAEALIKHLKNPDEFGTKLPVPSIAVCDKTFGTDMWRGPVWINYNYMIAEGLRKYGFEEEYKDIISKTVECMNRFYQKRGVIFEFYDCNDEKTPPELYRKGEPVEPYNFEVRTQAIRDFGWSCTLLCDILAENYAKKR